MSNSQNNNPLGSIVGLGKSNHVFSNWAKIYSNKPQLYFQPTSIDEVVSIVKECNKQGKTLTVVGSGHSPSDMCVSENWLLNLDHLDKILSFKDHGTYADVEVEAGIRVYKLNEILDQRGYSIQNLGSISEQSVAGIISTGTHGSSPFHGLVSSQYVNLTIINGSGELQFLDSDHEPEIFKSALLSLGKIGIIVKATIRTIPQYRIKSQQEVINFETLLDKWDEIWTSCEFIRCWWYPYTRKCILWRGWKTEEPLEPAKTQSWWGTTIGRFTYEALLWISTKIYPALTPRVEKFVFSRQYGEVETYGHDDVVVQTSIDGLNMDCLFSQFVDEWGCPLKNGLEVLKKLDKSITEAAKNNEFFVHVPVEVRCSNTTLPSKHLDYSKRTPLSAGPVYGNLLRPYLDPTPKDLKYTASNVSNDQLTLYINATIYRPFGFNTPIYNWFTCFEKILTPAGGKPHWAKNFIGDVSMLPSNVEPKKSYKDYEMRGMASLMHEWYGEDLLKWKKIREQQDPNGVFLANKDWCLRNGLI
ncbi:D-arabinono-1,4-lactone oxidase [Hanseniaspora osmophila]